MHYKQVEALHESEKKRAQQKIEELGRSLAEAENVNREQIMQLDGLKEEIREMERAKIRGNANMDYLKNIIVKFMETQDTDVCIFQYYNYYHGTNIYTPAPASLFNLRPLSLPLEMPF